MSSVWCEFLHMLLWCWVCTKTALEQLFMNLTLTEESARQSCVRQDSRQRLIWEHTNVRSVCETHPMRPNLRGRVYLDPNYFRVLHQQSCETAEQMEWTVRDSRKHRGYFWDARRGSNECLYASPTSSSSSPPSLQPSCNHRDHWCQLRFLSGRRVGVKWGGCMEACTQST